MDIPRWATEHADWERAVTLAASTDQLAPEDATWLEGFVASIRSAIADGSDPPMSVMDWLWAVEAAFPWLRES